MSEPKEGKPNLEYLCSYPEHVASRTEDYAYVVRRMAEWALFMDGEHKRALDEVTALREVLGECVTRLEDSNENLEVAKHYTMNEYGMVDAQLGENEATLTRARDILGKGDV